MKVVNEVLNRFPSLRKRLRGLYSRFCYVISKKQRKIGDIIRFSLKDGKEYFFGYYDKSPWNADDSFILCLRANKTWKNAASNDPADILLINTEDLTHVKIATTHSWNVQQGCMLQWLGPNYDKEIIYNDFRDEKFCSVILDVQTSQERVLPMPVYSVSSDGTFALTLDFARLHRLRPGYGYMNRPDKTEKEWMPEGACVWKIDLITGECHDVLRYSDLYDFERRADFDNAVHGVNHIMISPNNDRFMFLHRWFANGQLSQEHKKTRLITCGIDGSDKYILNDDEMVSHCFWRDNEHILSFEKKGDVVGYFLMRDKSNEYVNYWSELNNSGRINNDGHPSYSQNRGMVITDTYANYQRMAKIILIKDPDKTNYSIQKLAEVFHPFKYDNDTRCDLHPRWSRGGRQICFDGVFEGKRGLYGVNIK